MQSIPTNNEQMMKTKLHTFALKHILCKTVKNWLKCIELAWVKLNVKPVGLYESTS